MPEFFPGMDVRKMDFDRRYSARFNGIVQSDARVGVSRRVEHDPVELSLCLLNPANEFALQISLAEFNCYLKLIGFRPNQGFDVLQTGPAIDSRLTLAKQIQVRAVEEEDFHQSGQTIG